MFHNRVRIYSHAAERLRLLILDVSIVCFYMLRFGGIKLNDNHEQNGL